MGFWIYVGFSFRSLTNPVGPFLCKLQAGGAFWVEGLGGGV